MADGRIPRRRIGASDLQAGTVGVGTWQWGDRAYWDDHDGQEPTDIEAAYHATVERGADFLDTAELYGFGESERVIGRLRTGDARPAVVATKYMPAPTRWRVRAADAAIDASLKRLGVDQIDLYQVHWPYSFIPHRRLLRRLARAVHDGRLAHVGVSNFTAPQMRRAHAVLADAGVPLVSNQVSYSLLRRAPEVNGVLDACHELDVTLIAYSPLAQGLLSGKYGPGGRQPRCTADAARPPGQDAGTGDAAARHPAADWGVRGGYRRPGRRGLDPARLGGAADRGRAHVRPGGGQCRRRVDRPGRRGPARA